MKTIKEIKQEMLTTIRDYIIPFWLDNSVDTQYGGYITSFDEIMKESCISKRTLMYILKRLKDQNRLIDTKFGRFTYHKIKLD